jgi:hypothetical protein
MRCIEPQKWVVDQKNLYVFIYHLFCPHTYKVQIYEKFVFPLPFIILNILNPSTNNLLKPPLVEPAVVVERKSERQADVGFFDGRTGAKPSRF